MPASLRIVLLIVMIPKKLVNEVSTRMKIIYDVKLLLRNYFALSLEHRPPPPSKKDSKMTRFFIKKFKNCTSLNYASMLANIYTGEILFYLWYTKLLISSSAGSDITLLCFNDTSWWMKIFVGYFVIVTYDCINKQTNVFHIKRK